MTDLKTGAETEVERRKKPLFSYKTKSMNRHERREEARQIKRELTRLKQDKIYLNILKDSQFADQVKQNLVMFEDGEMPTEVQFKYGKAIDFLAKVNQLNERLSVLEKVQNLPYIKKK